MVRRMARGSIWERGAEDRVYNTASVIDPEGVVVARYRKMFPFLPYERESAPGTETVFNGRCYLYFGGVSYYGLHADAELMERGIETWRQLGLSSATSRSGMGTTPIYPRLEEAAAKFFDSEDAAYLVSGYLSNLAGIQALAESDPFDVVFVDEDSQL